MVGDMEATSLAFATAARQIATAARLRGLDVPTFRSPPRIADVDRSIRRSPTGGVTVSVRLKGRPWTAVEADMVDGVVATNELEGRAADRCRSALWLALQPLSQVAA